MKVWIVLPVRPLGDGKRRLATALTAAERKTLNGWFFDHTLAAALSVVPPERCLVVSADPTLHAGAAHAVEMVPEPSPGGLNRALSAGALAARARGADAVLSLSCDLPLLRGDDLSAMLAAAAPQRLVIAPDHHGTGTNALLMAPAGIIPYHHGPGSRAAHESAALAAGLTVVHVDRPGLARDIDTPDDLLRSGLLQPGRGLALGRDRTDCG